MISRLLFDTASGAAHAVPVLAANDGEFNPLEFASGAAFWTVVIFLLALLPMWKFVFGPITRALDARDRKVDDAIAAAETARRQAEEQVAATKQELEQSQRQARERVAEAVARAERQADEKLREAAADAERRLEQARGEIEAMKRAALDEIRREVVDLSIQAASHVLHRDLDDDAHRRLVDDFVQSASGGRV